MVIISLNKFCFGHKNRIGGLGQHYGGQQGCGYENLRMMIIEKTENGNPDLLAKREIYWQNQLRCFMENGGRPIAKGKKNSELQLLVQISFWYDNSY